MPHNNPTKPTVLFTVDYTHYRLEFDFEAIAEAEDLTGRSLLTGLNRKDVQSPSISLVRTMLFACLHSNHPELTLDEVKGFVNRKNLVETWGKVLEAWTAGLAEPDEVQATADPTPGQS